MTDPSPPAGAQPGRGRTILIVAAVVVVVGAITMIGAAVRSSQLNARLLRADPDRVAQDAGLVRYAESLARPAYVSHCVACHGADLQGSQAKGAPSLKDPIWLYGTGGVGDIERTLLYGIRSGNAKSRNITDMPAIGRTLQLSPDEVRDVETFVFSLTRREKDTAAVVRGSQIFQGKGVCYDCHSGDARGNPDYGAPDFTDNEWLYGGDEKTVYDSIYSGRHGKCPAWIDTLRPGVIRAMAVYLYTRSHQRPPAGAPSHG